MKRSRVARPTSKQRLSKCQSKAASFCSTALSRIDESAATCLPLADVICEAEGAFARLALQEGDSNRSQDLKQSYSLSSNLHASPRLCPPSLTAQGLCLVIQNWAPLPSQEFTASSRQAQLPCNSVVVAGQPQSSFEIAEAGLPEDLRNETASQASSLTGGSPIPPSPRAAISSKRKPLPKELLLHCLMPVWQCLPTSELVRLYSTSVAVLSKFWGAALALVLEMRTPSTIKPSKDAHVTLPRYVNLVLVDRAGFEIRRIKRPGLFRDSPLADLVGEALVPFCDMWSIFKALFAPLRYLHSLTLSVDPPDVRMPFSEELFAESVAASLPDLRSFSVENEPDLSSVARFELAKAIGLMPNLKRLCASAVLLRMAFSGARSPSSLLAPTAKVLSGLESFTLTNDVRSWPERSLSFLSELGARMPRLSELSLIVNGDLGEYMRAYGQLPELEKLCLRIGDPLKLSISNDNENVVSVIDLSIECSARMEDAQLFKILSPFPEVQTFCLQAWPNTRLVSMFLTVDHVIRQNLLPRLQTLKLKTANLAEDYSELELLEFLEQPTLPRTVDLSDFALPTLSGTDVLLRLFRLMQTNRISTLFLRARMHYAALCAFEGFLSDGNFSHVTLQAWSTKPEKRPIALVLAPHRYFVPTDLKISGRKTGGRDEGTEFMVRMHLTLWSFKFA